MMSRMRSSTALRSISDRLGKSRESAASGAAPSPPRWKLATMLCGSCSPSAGSSMRKKFARNESHSTFRRLVTSATISRSPKRRVSVSPSFRPNMSTHTCSTEIDGFAGAPSNHCPCTSRFASGRRSLQLTRTSPSMKSAARRSLFSAGCGAWPLIATSLPAASGSRLTFDAPSACRRSRSASCCSGCRLIANQLGVSAGRSARQRSSSDGPITPSTASAVRLSASAPVCSRVSARRRARLARPKRNAPRKRVARRRTSQSSTRPSTNVASATAAKPIASVPARRALPAP